MGAFIALIACIVVILLLILRVVVTSWIERRLKGRCVGRCGRDGWIVLRDDGLTIHRWCKRCEWVSVFNRRQKEPFNE